MIRRRGDGHRLFHRQRHCQESTDKISDPFLSNKPVKGRRFGSPSTGLWLRRTRSKVDRRCSTALASMAGGGGDRESDGRRRCRRRRVTGGETHLTDGEARRGGAPAFFFWRGRLNFLNLFIYCYYYYNFYWLGVVGVTLMFLDRVGFF